MHFFVKKISCISDWIRDNNNFMDAYNAANRDPALKAEISQLERKYIRQHLTELVGEDEADRIMFEKGYVNGMDSVI